MQSAAQLAPVIVENRILFIRGHKVMLDSDLAALYEVETKALNQAVKRNVFRFPADFMFRLTRAEASSLSLRSQSVTSKGGRRYLPYVFTEHGVAMLSSVLSSRRAIEVNIGIVRTFVRLREFLATQTELARRIEQLEWHDADQDTRIQAVFDAIQNIIDAPAEEQPKRRIGFLPAEA
jgi:ORF6N domain